MRASGADDGTPTRTPSAWIILLARSTPTYTHTLPQCPPLPCGQLFLEECVQRFFLAFPAEPQWLGGFQVAHHRQKLLLLPQMNLVHAHLPQRRLAPRCGPSLQIAQVDR